MSRNALFSEAFGATRDPSLALTDAIYASAAFPFVFPPMPLRLSEIGLSGGTEQAIDRPARLLLSDGGIYNNLGTDWFQDTADLPTMLFDAQSPPDVEISSSS